jgi:hypothetical protein
MPQRQQHEMLCCRVNGRTFHTIIVLIFASLAHTKKLNRNNKKYKSRWLCLTEKYSMIVERMIAANISITFSR